MSNALSKGVKSLFDERSRFIIIGLTGRTGSGCSTAADILRSEYNNLSLSTSFLKDKNVEEKLRYEIVKKYAEKNWMPFRLIRIKDIITSFILEENLEKFICLISQTIDVEIDKVASEFSRFLLTKYSELHRKRNIVRTLIKADEIKALESDQVYRFYFDELPIFTDNIKNYLDVVTPSGFTKIYQMLGNNIRTSGNAYESTFNPKHLHILAQRTNALIKILRRRSKVTGEPVLVCIDSVRNPYEASFFKERYSSFYLWSITTSDENRIRRLHNNNLSDGQIKRLDSIEYPKKLIGFKKLTSLNIQQCIQVADVHIHNIDVKGKKFTEFTWKLMKYVTLIMHPGIINPTAEERLMQTAYNAKMSSGCISRQVGAVVTDSCYSIKSIGWNDTPHGQVPCILRDAEKLINEEYIEIFSDYEIKDSVFRKTIDDTFRQWINDSDLNGRNLAYCFKDIQNYIDGEKNQVHTRALHAEENAFLQISKHGGTPLMGGFLFTTASPCELCSKKAYQIGIRKIFFIDPYPGIADKHILASGENRPELRMFEGAIGRAYQQLYEPIIPHKDVLDLIINLYLPTKKHLLEAEIKELKMIIAEKEEIILEIKPEIYGFEK